MKRKSFVPLFATNFFGTMNDNFLKTLASFVVIGWLSDPAMKPVFMGLTAGALVLPYILFSPLADRLTAIFPKRRIVRLAKWAELPIMAVAVLGFMLHSPILVVTSVLLMGLQSSLYSPAKYALVRDIGGEERISTGMGGMEGVSFLGVLLGTIAASFVVDRVPAWVHYACLAGFALAGLMASYTIKAKEEMSRALVAAMLQMGLLVYGKAEAGLNLDATRTGLLLCGAAVGIVAGQVIAGLVDRRHFLMGATLLTGWIAAALLMVLFFAPLSPRAFGIALGVLAFDLGFFKLPLDAEIQKVVKGPKLNTILAYFNQVSFLFMLAASGCYALVSWLWGPRAFLLLLGVVMAVTPFAFVFNYRKALVFTGRWIFRRRYRVEVDGLAAVAQDKTYLVLPNHPAMVDPMLVVSELWRTPLRPLADESFFHAGIVAPKVLKTLGAVAVPDLRKHRSATGAKIARGLNDVVLGALADGKSVIFYPAGHIHTEEGHEEIGTRQLAYNVCHELPPGVEVVGVRTTGLWGSIWSRAGRTSSPAFVPTLLKSVFLWFFWAPFVPCRRVTMRLENLTARVREWAQLPRLDFNRRLEAWYNGETSERAK